MYVQYIPQELNDDEGKLGERTLEPLVVIPYVLNRLAADVEKMEYEPAVGCRSVAALASLVHIRPKEIGSSISDLSSFSPCFSAFSSCRIV